jgi:hypothetical protein
VYIMPCMLLLWCRGCSRPDGATSVILCSYRTPCNYICSYCIHVHIPKLGLYLDTVTLVPASPRDCLPPRLSFDRRLGRRAGLCTCYLWRALKAVFQDIPGVILRTSPGSFSGHPKAGWIRPITLFLSPQYRPRYSRRASSWCALEHRAALALNSFLNTSTVRIVSFYSILQARRWLFLLHCRTPALRVIIIGLGGGRRPQMPRVRQPR